MEFGCFEPLFLVLEWHLVSFVQVFNYVLLDQDGEDGMGARGGLVHECGRGRPIKRPLLQDCEHLLLTKDLLLNNPIQANPTLLLLPNRDHITIPKFIPTLTIKQINYLIIVDFDEACFY